MKIAAFIDGANMYAAGKNLGMPTDYSKLLKWLKARGELVRAYYYTSVLDEDEEFSPIRPLLDWLDYNGYALITKPAKEFTDYNGNRRIKGNMDIELAIGMMELAERVNHIYLFSGDGDFRTLVEAVQRKGVRVTVVSTIQSSPQLAADELRRQCDGFIDLGDIKEIVKVEKPRVSNAA